MMRREVRRKGGKEQMSETRGERRREETEDMSNC